MKLTVPDKNLIVETALGETNVVFHNVRNAPFELYGLYDPQGQPQFQRLPDEIGQNTNPGVAVLYRNTAGGRVRFSTDSPYVAIRCTMPGACAMPHITLLGSSGFDMFCDDPTSGSSRFCGSFIPPTTMTDGYESIIRLRDRRMRYFTINFPTYNPVTELYIGLAEGSAIGDGMKYRPLDPIVYYGSSITQGGCCARPGNTYQSIISRRLRIDHINLGFSGSGLAEDIMIRHLASLPMCAFVSDYDHNAPDPAHLWATHYKMYETVRASHPDIPYIIISRPDFLFDPLCPERRDAIYDTYRRARNGGDRHVFYIDGESLFRGPYEDMCTVDGCHPTDLGFALMADAIGCELDRELNWAR